VPLLAFRQHRCVATPCGRAIAVHNVTNILMSLRSFYSAVHRLKLCPVSAKEKTTLKLSAVKSKKLQNGKIFDFRRFLVIFCPCLLQFLWLLRPAGKC